MIWLWATHKPCQANHLHNEQMREWRDNATRTNWSLLHWFSYEGIVSIYISYMELYWEKKKKWHRWNVAFFYWTEYSKWKNAHDFNVPPMWNAMCGQNRFVWHMISKHCNPIVQSNNKLYRKRNISCDRSYSTLSYKYCLFLLLSFIQTIIMLFSKRF